MLPSRNNHCDEPCTIELPLTTDPLLSLIDQLRIDFSHNFIPCIMTMASAILTLHYQTIIKKLKFCPIPIAFGQSGTGKTAALLCGLSMFGAHENRFYSKLTKERILALCSGCSIPLGVDDPDSKNHISRLVIDLFNRAKSGTIGHGDKKPCSTCIISANFTTKEQHKYVRSAYN